MSHYWKHKAYMIAMLLLVVGGLNWGAKSMLKLDLVTYVTGKNIVLANVIFGLVGLAALFIGLNRDAYLPFLGQTLIPCSVLTPQTPENADIETQVLASPGTKILFWAAEPANKDLNEINDWQQAYLAYRNAGIAVTDATGIAKLKVRKPQPYRVPVKGVLSPHIHYRKCMGDGLMSRVHTVDLDEKEFFENYVSMEETLEPVVEKESFENYVSMQETLEPVIEKSEFNYVKPSQALEETKTVTIDTLQKSIMTESGAPDEGNLTAGSPLDNAVGIINSPLAGASLDDAFAGKGI